MPRRRTLKLFCKRGHAMRGGNVYVTPSTGHRSCRTCNRLLDRVWRRSHPRSKALGPPPVGAKLRGRPRVCTLDAATGLSPRQHACLLAIRAQTSAIGRDATTTSAVARALAIWPRAVEEARNRLGAQDRVEWDPAGRTTLRLTPAGELALERYGTAPAPLYGSDAPCPSTVGRSAGGATGARR